jgi:HK97 gp10 family phage protein
MRIRLEGSKEVQAALREASDDVRAEAAKVVTKTALALRADIVKSIQRGPASGRTYRKYNPNRTHTASAPGQPPMSDTGRLANSIEFDKSVFGGNLTATVGSRLAYALYLEYGTSRMSARPFFRPAVERMQPKFVADLEAAISGAIR